MIASCYASGSSVVQKCTYGGVLHEAVIVGGDSKFLYMNDGYPALTDKIDTSWIPLQPPRPSDYLNLPYEFESVDQIQTIVKVLQTGVTRDSIHKDLKKQWGRYVGGTQENLTVCAASTMFSYFQDALASTHYLALIGHNEFDASPYLQLFRLLGYRAYYEVGMAPISICNYLGTVEEGQGILVDAELGNISGNREKMKILKSGWTSGGRVIRVGGRRRIARAYWTFGLKVLATDSATYGSSARLKGLGDLMLPVRCMQGANPTHDINEVVGHGGDSKYEALHSELLELRNRLLIFRLLHFQERIPHVKLLVTGAEKQLCQPLVRLYRNTKALTDVTSALGLLIAERRRQNRDTLVGELFNIVYALALANGYHVTNAQVWQTLQETLPGQEMGDKAQSYSTEAFGVVSKKQAFKIMQDMFYGVPTRDKERGFKFEKSVLERLATTYGGAAQGKNIKILADDGRSKKDAITDRSTQQLPQTPVELSQNKQEPAEPVRANPSEPLSSDNKPKETVPAAMLGTQVSKVSKVSAPTTETMPRHVRTNSKPRADEQGMANAVA